MRYFIVALLTICLCSCSDGNEIMAPQQAAGVKRHYVIRDIYRVQRGDTIYTVAWQFGLDYRTLAFNNRLNPPYKLYEGTELNLASTPAPRLSPRYPSAKRSASRQNGIKRKSTTRNTMQAPPQQTIVSNIYWQRPTSGSIIARFSTKNRGIDIVGSKGQAIMTTAPGVVVYAGTGIRGYGKLLIIKHNDEFLSAYAHNSDLLVKENDVVKRGQIIAKMGNTGSNRVMLHFELRRGGKPVNPLDYIRN